ncbi:unnamed protein product [Rotaria sp. Silwood2]|nr:unnamed protein product [Rotaria sp. Silwood2]
MDDNKLLTLANEERIRLQDYCSLLFEVGDIKYASPATVSRYQLDLLYDRYTKNILNFIYHGLTETGQRPRMKTIVPFVQLTKLLDSLFLPLINHEKKDQLELSSDKIHAIFLQAFIWSFRVCLKQEDRIVLDIFIKYLSGLSTVSIDLKAKSGQLPNEKLLLFDYIFQPELDQCIKWNDLILKYENDRSKRFTELLVPTINTIRLGIIKTKNNIDLEWLIKSMIIIHQPVLFVGNTGSKIQEIIPNIIKYTLQIYEDILRLFLPTPTKFYYIFSLRDPSRIIQSLLQTAPERFNTIKRFLRIWLHECIRIFSDRFNDIKDNELFNTIVQNIIDNNSLLKSHRNYLFRKPILFPDYRTILQNDEAKIYEALQDYHAIKSIFDEIILKYKDKYGYIDIVFPLLKEGSYAEMS